MNIFEFAKKMEIDSEKYYHDMAAQAPDQGIAAIFKLLAQAESKHLRILRQLEKQAPCTDGCDDPILDNAKALFQKMRDRKTQYTFEGHYADLYQKAANDEAKAVLFYRKKAEETDNPNHREILLQLADAERQHQHLLENLVEFVSRPDTWLENAEFNHLDEY